MGSKAPTWADQWGSGNKEDDYEKSALSSKAGHGGSNKMDDVKAAASAGFDKAKAAATTGAKKLKSGSSVGIKWIKEKCQKKGSSN